MSELHVGDVYTARGTFRNAAGAPTNPTTATIRIQKPDGVTSTATPTSDGAGIYHHDIPIDQAGAWQYAFVGTGAVAAAEPGDFYVARSEVLA
jgi:hypothetical protein